MDQLVQLLASLVVLVAFVAAQRGLLHRASRRYLALNLVGSAILAVLAAQGRQWGFLLLESMWAVVAAWGLARHAAARLWPNAT